MTWGDVDWLSPSSWSFTAQDELAGENPEIAPLDDAQAEKKAFFFFFFFFFF
jgi:hypothetical protein